MSGTGDRRWGWQERPDTGIKNSKNFLLSISRPPLPLGTALSFFSFSLLVSSEHFFVLLSGARLPLALL